MAKAQDQDLDAKEERAEKNTEAKRESAAFHSPDQTDKRDQTYGDRQHADDCKYAGVGQERENGSKQRKDTVNPFFKECRATLSTVEKRTDHIDIGIYLLLFLILCVHNDTS